MPGKHFDALKRQSSLDILGKREAASLKAVYNNSMIIVARASLAIADMYERNSMRDLAFSKYAMVAAKHDVTSAFGWHARISRAKLVVLHEIGTNKDRAEIYALLCDMAKLGTTEQKADIFELLGKISSYR